MPSHHSFGDVSALGGDSLLAKFIWNSGGQWLDKPWTKDQPCDAQIVMHIFRSFMDEILVGEDPRLHRGLPFTNVYCSLTSANLNGSDSAKATFLIRQVTQYPPHSNLLIDKQTWAVIPVSSLGFPSFHLFDLKSLSTLFLELNREETMFSTQWSSSFTM